MAASIQCKIQVLRDDLLQHVVRVTVNVHVPSPAILLFSTLQVIGCPRSIVFCRPQLSEYAETQVFFGEASDCKVRDTQKEKTVENSKSSHIDMHTVSNVRC